MPTTMPGDCLILIIVLVAIHLPLRLPRLRLPGTLRTRRLAHLKNVKARAVAANEARQKQAALDAVMTRVYHDALTRVDAAADCDTADYETRMAQIETAPIDADLEEFYAQL